MPLIDWLKQLRRVAVNPARRSAPALPEAHRLYCIGDIHGRLDLLDNLHQQIDSDAADYDGVKIRVYLGDYIDRGPESRQVIDYLLASRTQAGFENVYLLGNHEFTLLRLMYGFDMAAAMQWLQFGGLSTLASYGIAVKGIPTAANFKDLLGDLSQRMPDQHKWFYQTLQLSFELGDYFFVHAGVRPKLALNKQREEDLLWIRDQFIDSERDHGKVIVHGHTVTEQPVIKANRIGLDTGAYSSGLLSCGVFEGQRVRVLQAVQK